MRWPAVVLSTAWLVPAGSSAEDKVVDWVRVTDRAGWQARDSSGEVVYQDRLWLLGGWLRSFAAPPRDVWRSPDGRTRRLAMAEAPWSWLEEP